MSVNLSRVRVARSWDVADTSLPGHEVKTKLMKPSVQVVSEEVMTEQFPVACLQLRGLQDGSGLDQIRLTGPLSGPHIPKTAT